MMRRRIAALLAAAACASGCDSSGPPGESTESARSQSAPPASHPGSPDSDGRFRLARDAAPADDDTADQRRLAAELEALGYASGSQPARASGVTRHDPTAAQAGLNFFTSGHGEVALLTDMDGNVLHEWRYRSDDALGTGFSLVSGGPERWWRRAYLLPDGDVVAIVTGAGVIRIDAASELVWATRLHAHHDLDFADDGTIWVLTRKMQRRPEIRPDRPIVDDGITVLDPEGRVLRTISIVDTFARSEFMHLWPPKPHRKVDVLHTNSIEILDGTAAAANPAFRAGNLLVSSRTLNALAVIDPEAERVVWAHRGDYRRQHDPKILSNGHLLLFDNQKRPPSAVLEVDLASMDVVWQFRGSETEPFFSKTCGTSERLDNGNTLITETDFGRVFEVTPDGRVVWEYYNPHRAGENDAFIASLPEVIRLPPDFPTHWIDGSTVSRADVAE